MIVAAVLASVPLGAIFAAAPANTVQIQPGRLPLVRTTGEWFQSFQLGFSHLTGGDTWVSYDKMTPEAVKERQYTGDLPTVREARAPTDLSHRRFRNLVAGLGPLYIRYGGTTTNTVYFQDNEEPKLAKAPAGYTAVLTRKPWREALDFAKAINAKIYTGFSVGHGVRDQAGVWTPVHAKAWLDYNKSTGGEIYPPSCSTNPTWKATAVTGWGKITTPRLSREPITPAAGTRR